MLIFRDINNILEELKTCLGPVQKLRQKNFSENRAPLGFIVGAPRSGTTLLSQWLANLGCFSYPTNTLARFAYAPYFGALIQQMLFERRFDPLEELNGSNEKEFNYTSNLGKSSGFLALNEFQHFFRIYINNYFPKYIPDEDFKKINFQELLQGLASIESVFEKPFITKAMMLQFNLFETSQKIPHSIFFYIKRDPVYVMQSIYESRKKYFKDPSKWWSVMPKEYDILKEKSLYEQIAGQVYYTEQAIEKDLLKIPEKRKITIQYEDFCNDPDQFISVILDKYNLNDCCLKLTEFTQTKFKVSNSITLNLHELTKFKNAYNHLKM
jgi:hypothetical protein